ncbi:MAG: hypothetical protein SOY76_02380 [Veillonella caviae]|nr:hypothetical protein [Veillonella caviae]
MNNAIKNRIYAIVGRYFESKGGCVARHEIVSIRQKNSCVLRVIVDVMVDMKAYLLDLFLDTITGKVSIYSYELKYSDVLDEDEV